MSRIGSDVENDAIVNAYFVMLENEQTGRDNSKTKHWRVLTETYMRPRESVHSKLMNISAVMDALGLPYLKGYAPLRNDHKELFEAVQALLTERPDLYNLLMGETTTLPDRTVESTSGETIVFDEAPPQRETHEQDIPEEIENIVSRFEHPAERDARNRILGKAGESVVYEYERRRLQIVGRKDLSDCVRWVARDDGDGYGYDIRSFIGEGDEADQELWLEVKTTNGSATTPFYITRNELQVSKQRPDAFRLFRLYDFRKRVRAYRLAPPLERHVSLTSDHLSSLLLDVANALLFCADRMANFGHECNLLFPFRGLVIGANHNLRRRRRRCRSRRR